MGPAVLKCPSCGAPVAEASRVCEFCGDPIVVDKLGLGLLERDPDRLIAEATAALKKNPDDPAAHCRLGAGQLKRGWHEEAIGEFEKSLRLRPDAWGVMYLEAFAIALGRSWGNPRVVELCGQALEANPQCREAQSLLHLGLGRQAEEALEPDYERALDEFRTALMLEIPEHMPYIYDFSGQAFDAADDKENAIKMYQEACSRGFANAAIFTRLGILLKDTGRPHLALFELEKASELDPANDAVKDLLAELRGQTRR